MYVIWHWPQASTFYFFFCSFDGKALNRASWYEYLGVVHDASLTWNVRVEYLSGKVRKRLAMLGRIRKNINQYTAGTVYKSFVLPLLDKTARLCGAAAGALTLISWRSCRGAQHVLLCVWGAAKKC